MPDAPEPETPLDPDGARRDARTRSQRGRRACFERIQPIEFRPLDLGALRARRRPAPCANPGRSLWIRINGPLPDDPAIHRAALAYLSDMTLIDTALVAHGHASSTARFQAASLDHALWLHRPFRADEWLLYVQDSPSAQGARGLTRGQLYTPRRRSGGERRAGGPGSADARPAAGLSAKF